jgi:hypothetical protein
MTWFMARWWRWFSKAWAANASGLRRFPRKNGDYRPRALD